jgi:hypothetical protein
MKWYLVISEKIKMETTPLHQMAYSLSSTKS